MAKSADRGGRGKPEKAESTPRLPELREAWATLAALGALAAGLSLFLWMELVLLRAGAGAFCASGGRFDCSAVWNGGFASAVHRMSGLPIAGWGVVWGIAAFLLPLTALRLVSEGRDPGALLAATRLTALAGAVGIVVMTGASLASGAFCVGCIATDLVVASYAFLAFRRGRSVPDAARGAGIAAMIAAGVFVLLLYPGLHTPRSSGESGRQAVLTAAASAPAGTDFASAGAATAATSPSGASPESVSSAPSSSASSSSEISRAPAVVPEVTPVPSRAGTGDPNRDALLVELVKALDPPSRQTLADSLAVYRASAGRPLPPPRALDGSSLAPVRITEFTDILCEHCASLQQTIRSIREHVTPDSFSVVARQFPLDARCNSLVSVTREDDVRCVAAKALICAEPSGKEPQLSAALFEKQEGLTSPKVLEIGGPMVPGLAPCIASPATQAKLNSDVAIAEKFDHDGTPIVIVNGRPATSFGPFLYALIVTRGNPDNPAFDALPPGNPAAHLH